MANMNVLSFFAGALQGMFNGLVQRTKLEIAMAEKAKREGHVEVMQTEATEAVKSMMGGQIQALTLNEEYNDRIRKAVLNAPGDTPKEQQRNAAAAVAVIIKRELAKAGNATRQHFGEVMVQTPGINAAIDALLDDAARSQLERVDGLFKPGSKGRRIWIGAKNVWGAKTAEYLAGRMEREVAFARKAVDPVPGAREAVGRGIAKVAGILSRQITGETKGPTKDKEREAIRSKVQEALKILGNKYNKKDGLTRAEKTALQKLGNFYRRYEKDVFNVETARILLDKPFTTVFGKGK